MLNFACIRHFEIADVTFDVDIIARKNDVNGFAGTLRSNGG